MDHTELPSDPKLDRIDLSIIRELQTDGRITLKELADKVNLSKTPCHARMRRLVEQGVIRRFTAQIDYERLGLGHVAFVQVKLSDTREGALRAFNKAVQSLPEIEQCHMMASSFDYLLKVRTRSIRDYRRVLGEEIAALPNVSNTSTFVSMETVKESESTLPG